MGKGTPNNAMTSDRALANRIILDYATKISPPENPMEYFAQNNSKFAHYSSLQKKSYEGSVLGQDSSASDRQMIYGHASNLGVGNPLLDNLLLELTYNHMPKPRQNEPEYSVY